MSEKKIKPSVGGPKPLPHGVDRERMRRLIRYALAHPRFLSAAHEPGQIPAALEDAGGDLVGALGGKLTSEEVAYITGFAELAAAKLSPHDLRRELGDIEHLPDDRWAP